MIHKRRAHSRRKMPRFGLEAKNHGLRPVAIFRSAASVLTALSSCKNFSGGCNPGDLNQSLMCEPVSACLALRRRFSRSRPRG